MTAVAFTLFDTAIGRCGIAWTDRGVAAIQLPEATDDRTQQRLLGRRPAATKQPPPPAIAGAVDGIVRILNGEKIDLSAVVLDMDGVPPFHRLVYEVARTITAGETLTYGDVAVRLGDSDSVRAVGQALGRNPFPIVVPCHRVLAAGGRVGGFSAAGGTATKRRILTIEGAVKDQALFEM